MRKLRRENVNRQTPEKRHALNKRVRREKARLRKRSKKHKSWRKKLILCNITLSPETMEKVIKEANRTHTSRGTVVRKVLSKFMREYKDGIQKEPDSKMD